MSDDADIIALAGLAVDIGEKIGFSFADADGPEDSEYLNDDGAWEYHFETDPSWGFVAAGPDGPIGTTYSGWGEIEIERFQWCAFHDNALAAVFTPKGGTVGGFVTIEGIDDIADLEGVMIDAFERERDALRGGEEIVTDGGFEIEHEDCGRCGGTGKIMEMVGGRSSLSYCPNCDNIPEYVIPDDLPADPEGFERLGRCKHGDEVATADRETEDREANHQGFDAFAGDRGATTPDTADDPGHGRPGGIDDPDPNAAYVDEPSEHAPPCDDCGEQEAERSVQCPVDEDLRLDLCAECYNERGPGIEVCHVRRDSDWDVNGGRASPTVEGGEQRHMNNTAFPAPGWIGNPHPMEEESDVERWRVLKAFREDLLRNVREEEFFAHHLGKLRGKLVACWCRTESESWPGNGDPCHLDIVHAALLGLYREG